MQRIFTLTVAIMLAVSLSACGGGSARSVKAYCDTVAKHRDRYLSAMNAATSSGGLAGLLTGASAIGDIKNMWTKVAPDEIQTDTEAVRDAWKQAEAAAQNGNYIGAITAALSNNGPANRVNAYIAEHCGRDYVP